MSDWALTGTGAPAWFRVLASAVDSEWPGKPAKWNRIHGRAVRSWLDDRKNRNPGKRSRLAAALIAHIEKSAHARAWLDSKAAFSAPYITGFTNGDNPLGLSSDEIANFCPPPELREDPDILEAQAFASGFYGEWATGFGINITAGGVQRGIRKISRLPLTMILVASPHFEYKTLVQIDETSLIANLQAVDESLNLGSEMSDHALRAWLSNSFLAPAVMGAVELRNKHKAPRTRRNKDGSLCGSKHRFPCGGWWYGIGCPTPPPPARAKRAKVSILNLFEEVKIVQEDRQRLRR